MTAPDLRTAPAAQREATSFPPAVAVPMVALVFAGMVDLLFERIVYRVGIHIPRDPSVMSAYRSATAVGDGAFRYVMVLAVFAAIAAAVYLVSSRLPMRRTLGVALLALAIVDTVTIRSNDPHLGLAVNALFAGALSLMVGVAVGGTGARAMRLSAIVAGVALLAGQYPVMAARVSDISGGALPGAASSLTIAEAAVVAFPLVLVIGARPWDRPAGRTALVAGALAGGIAALAFSRAASTVAILSLWGTGVTMSFPAPVYVIALAAAVTSAVVFASESRTRHLAVAAGLLLVAGVQPTVTQYNLAALLGMAILVLGPEPAAALAGARDESAERAPGACELRPRLVTSDGGVAR